MGSRLWGIILTKAIIPLYSSSDLNNEMCVQHVQQEVSPRTSGRLSHSSGPLNGGQSCGGSLTDSPPVSPSEMEDLKVLLLN